MTARNTDTSPVFGGCTDNRETFGSAFLTGFGATGLFLSGGLPRPCIRLSEEDVRSDWETVGSYIMTATREYRK
jgi:hypothetical protein